MSFAMPRLMPTLLLCIAALAVGCGGPPEDRSPDLQLLATDVHVAVARHTLVLPFVALADHAAGGMSFSLNRKVDARHAAQRRTALLRETRDHERPLALDLVSVTVHSYGASDFDSRRSRLCSRLSRQWARSVCDDSLGVIRRALPPGRFKLIDLARLRLDDPRGPGNCLRDRKHTALPSVPGRGVIVCPALVFGGDEDEFHTAVVRIDGDLGAMWTVWRNGQNGESAEAMAAREGNAIALFVETALGEREDYPKLERGMCPLMRPGI